MEIVCINVFIFANCNRIVDGKTSYMYDPTGIVDVMFYEVWLTVENDVHFVRCLFLKTNPMQ